MRTIFFWCWFILILYVHGAAQKKVIDNESYKTWPRFNNCGISNDGRYIWSEYSKGGSGPEVYISSVSGALQRKLFNATGAVFSPDNRSLVFKTSEGISIFKMEDSSTYQISGAESFLVPPNRHCNWMSYRRRDTISLYNFYTKEHKVLGKGTAVFFDKTARYFMLQNKDSLICYHMTSFKKHMIFSGAGISNLKINPDAAALVFTTSYHDDVEIWYYKFGDDNATLLISNKNVSTDTNFVLAHSQLSFSKDGRRIFFKLKRRAVEFDKDTTVITDRINIWHYQDSLLQSQQLRSISKAQAQLFTAVSSIENINIIQLENDDRTLISSAGEKFAIVSNSANNEDWMLDRRFSPKYFLINIKNGDTESLPSVENFSYDHCLSPSEKFVIWTDGILKRIFCYEISSGLTRELGADIPYDLFNERTSRPTAILNSLVYWLPDDNGILLSDQYDIWQIDPYNRGKSVNITLGYGRANNIELRILDDVEIQKSTLAKYNSLWVTGINSDNLNNGLFRLTLAKTHTLSVILPSQPALFYHPGFGKMPPIKARDADVYIFQECRDTLATKLLVLRGFKVIKTFLGQQPQKEYEWFTTSLIHWPIAANNIGTGILYKPQNFDSLKKYPVIFTYYEHRSYELRLFLDPGLGNGQISIPWYVSNGYLVFVPDIYRPSGRPAESVANTVISAAKYLSGFCFVDSAKMGLQGHSFGGYETLVVVTRSDMFAAAQASAGPSNLVSFYGATSFGGRSVNFFSEFGQLNMGVSLWKDKARYINNSPVFAADKINTPLLLMYNKGDDAVPFAQGIEIFTALRRLRKPVWLLEYDDEGHVIFNQECQQDFTIRQQEFFNHYLKNASAPSWLTKGIPARKKGKVSGLLLKQVE